MSDVQLLDPEILEGREEQVPPLSSKIVRVFLSSTFSDMTEERNMLMKRVYPKLKEYAMKKFGALFQVVDMRWGVTQEAQNDHMTSAICLKEIKNCQHISVGPDFVALIGQKYGYRPIPATIDGEEYEVIRAELDRQKEDITVLDTWYLRDENVVPPQFVLQPINAVLKNYDSSDDDLKRKDRKEWAECFEEMRDLLKKGADLAFDAGKIGGQTKEKYSMSVTEEEIQLGVLQAAGDVNKKCLCFIRNIEDLEENKDHHRALKFLDLVPGTNDIDSNSQNMLNNLRNRKLTEKLSKNNIVRLKTTWSDIGGINETDNEAYLSELGEAFYDKMTWLIEENLSQVENGQDEEQKTEIIQSLQIRNDWSRIFYGREDILAAVKNYVKDEGNQSPFALYGESGCGKTALIAKCAKLARTWCSSDSAVTVVRFLGTSPQTSHIFLTLLSICKQISNIYRPDMKRFPYQYKETVELFHSLLEFPTRDKPLLIFIDSIDQLAASLDPYKLLWLPRTLPKNVKIVVSFIPTHHNILKNFKGLLADRQSNVELIPMLGDMLSMEVLRARLKSIDRTITEQQENLVADLFTRCSLPLFGRIMFDEVSTWKSFSNITPSMVSASIKDALHFFFQRLEMQHGRELVSHCLSYITAAREGISEVELLDLLSLDDEVLGSIFLFWLPPVRRIPPFLWTRLKLDLDKFLVIREAGDVEVLCWYHRQFKQVARERYLRNEEAVESIHANMAEYFMGTWGDGRKKPFTYSTFIKSRLALTKDDGEEDRNVPSQPLELRRGTTGTIYNKRKLNELPLHLTNCKRFDVLSEICIFNYQWLWTKLKVNGLMPVVEDLQMAHDVCQDNEIQTLADALRIAGSTLSANPDLLALEITGRLLDLFDTMPKIKNLIHQCDFDGQVHSAILAPNQLYELPISALTCALDAGGADIADIEFVKKGSEIISVTIDGLLRKFDVVKGEVLKELALPQLKTIAWTRIGLYKTRDEKFIIVRSKPTNFYLEMCTVDVDSFELVSSQKVEYANIHHTIVTSKKHVCMDNAVFEVGTGKKINNLNSYRKIKSFVTVAFTHDNAHILLGGETAVEMYTIQKAKKVRDLPVTNTVSTIELTTDGRLAIIGTIGDCDIKIYDVNVISPTFGQEIVTYSPNKAFPNKKLSASSYSTTEVSELCVSHKQTVFVSVVKREYPIVWSLKNISTKPILLTLPAGGGPVRYLFNVQFSADDRFILAAELSPNVMMWDAVSGELLSIFTAHQNQVHDLMLSPASNVAITIPQGGSEIKIWDIKKLLKMEELSTRQKQTFSVQGITFSNRSNLVFISRIQPPKGSKAYHYIDYFGIDVLDLASGCMSALLPFDKYGALQNLAVSKDASTLVITTGTPSSSYLSVISLKTQTLIRSLTVLRFKGIKLSVRGEYMAVFTHDMNSSVTLYELPSFDEIGSYESCLGGMFTAKSAFIGISADKELLIRESPDDDETLKLALQGDVKTIHYCDVNEILLLGMDDSEESFATVYKTEGFGAIGTITGIAKDGICDIASDGSICIDAELQIFELQRCRRVKKLFPGTEKTDISSVKLSKNGQHAVFIENKPSECIKVCRLSDSQIIGKAMLHALPEIIEIVHSSDVIITIAKDKSLFILALKDRERDHLMKARTRAERLALILGNYANETLMGTQLQIPESVREFMKEQTKLQQTKNFTLERRKKSLTDENGAAIENSVTKDQMKDKYVETRRKSSMCDII